MKTIILSILLTAALAAVQHNALAQSDVTTFKVSGVCETCKERIEIAAQGKGIKNANWDMETRILTLKVDPQKFNLKKVHQRIAAAGYDTELEKASTGSYEDLPECCRYRTISSMDDFLSKITTTIDTVSIDTIVTAAAPVTNPGIVKGVVMEKPETGGYRPLIGATVSLVNSQISVVTDSTGAFSIKTDEENPMLAFSFTGFHRDTIAVTGKRDIQVLLTPSNRLREVIITAPKRATYINTYDPFRTEVITRKELQKAACCNLSESFETNPSVDVSYNDAVTGSKQIHLLGLAGPYTQLTVENLPGPRGLATPFGLNSIPGTWIESIQLIKGTGSVVNGFESIAGQINVELKKPETSGRLFANVYVNDYGKTDLNLDLTAKLGKHWSTALLLHDAFLVNKTDINRDGFRDLPTGNLFTAVNRWSYHNENGISTHFGVKLLGDVKTGGQMEFDPSKHKLTTDQYGLQIDTKHWEVFGKVGYVFPGAAHKSIGLQLSTFNHQQDSYFGLTSYDGKQTNVYSNLIYQSQIGSNRHKFRTGISMVSDRYDERLNSSRYERSENVAGGFFEYTFSPSKKLDVVAGIREDRNNLYGWFTTPRLNVRYQPFQNTVIRGSFGRGQRTANILAENNSVFVSGRTLQIIPSATGKGFGLDPEIAWNKGIGIDQKFRLFNRPANVSSEFFRTDFKDQVTVDLEDHSRVKFYNKTRRSYSNSFQTTVTLEPLQDLAVKLAYRYFDVVSSFGNQELQKPFTSKHRGFANLAYEIKNWKMDYTVSFNGRKRLPSTADAPLQYRQPAYSPFYVGMNAQISKTLGKQKNIDLYIGGENLTNYMQPGLIISAEQPFSPHFDASMVWGPVNGRMIYGGLRFTLK